MKNRLGGIGSTVSMMRCCMQRGSQHTQQVTEKGKENSHAIGQSTHACAVFVDNNTATCRSVDNNTAAVTHAVVTDLRWCRLAEVTCRRRKACVRTQHSRQHRGPLPCPRQRQQRQRRHTPTKRHKTQRLQGPPTLLTHAASNTEATTSTTTPVHTQGPGTVVGESWMDVFVWRAVAVGHHHHH